MFLVVTRECSEFLYIFPKPQLILLELAGHEGVLERDPTVVNTTSLFLHSQDILNLKIKISILK
jgi:hypothetical protein